ncbi:MAG: HEAT repeat domain-containing protein [Proteobacteria bacterium]|nr:HEAT repeat domain-containing protein [Pseudomonadota bacterium]
MGSKAPRAPKTAPTVAAPDLTPLVTQLGATDLEAAARAAQTLGMSDVPAAHDALLDALAMGLPASVAIEALAALALHPAPTDVAHLKRYATHRNPNVRGSAVASLAGYPDPVATAAVIAALHDHAGIVRGAAATAAGRGHIRAAVEPLMMLLELGEEPAARGLAALADVDLAAKIADRLGKVPDATLALCLGLILKRPDFGSDAAKVEIVRAIGKIQDKSAVMVLAEYVDATPPKPVKPSRVEAEGIVNARLGGGK